MFKILEFIVEAVYWSLIFLCPTLIAGMVAIWIYFKWEQATVPVIILGIGIVCGVLLAERIRRKYGCTEFYNRLRSTGGDAER